MKKAIFAVLFAFELVFGASVHGGQLVLPDPNAKLSETVNLEPVSETLKIKELESVLEPFEYKIKRGDNLTKLAKSFGTTVEKLLSMNPGIRNKNLILAGAKLRVPLYTAAAMKNLAENVARDEYSAGFAAGQNSLWRYFVGMFLALLITLILFFMRTEQNKNLKCEKAEAKDELKALEIKFANVHTKLDLAREQLRLKEGADEKIKEQKQEIDRLVEKVSGLYMDNEVLSVNLAEAQAKIEGMGRQLKALPNQFMVFDSQEHGKISVKILRLDASKEQGREGELDVFVECPKRDCLVNVARSLKAQNALSHMGSSDHWPTAD